MERKVANRMKMSRGRVWQVAIDGFRNRRYKSENGFDIRSIFQVARLRSKGMLTMRHVRFTDGVLLAALVAGGCGQSSSKPALPVLSVGSQVSKPVVKAESVSMGPASRKAGELLAKGQFAEALEQATLGIKESPRSAQAYETRASVYHKLGRLDEATADFTSAVELEPWNARLLNNRGFLYLTREKFDLAVADFDAAIAADPGYANSWNNRGLLQIAQGRYRQAVLDLDQALRVNPDYVDACNNRGFALMHLGVWERALGDFQRALGLDPKNANAMANRGFAKQNLGDTDGAILDFTTAMMLDPDNPKYYVHRRESYLRQGALEQAQQDAAKIQELQEVQRLNSAIARQPASAGLLLERSRYFLRKKDATRAEADLARAVQLAPTRVDVRLERAALLVKRQDFKAAEADCAAVLAVEPHQQAFSIRGDARLELGDLDGALADFEQAKRLDTRVAEAYFLKGEALSRQGDSAAAKEYQDRAAAIDPTVAVQQK